MLWNNEYPVQLCYQALSDLDEYLLSLSEPTHYLITNKNNYTVGWAVAFDRDNERWFAIIVDNKSQGKGYGTQLLNMLKKDNSQLNGWVTDHNDYKKSNGNLYPSPLAFYTKNGFELLANERLETENLSAVKIRSMV